MKRLAAAFAVMFVSAAQAQELPRQFDLECKDVKRNGTGGELEEGVSLVLYVDLDRKLACREWMNSCFVRPIVDQGRWIDFSYDFKSGTGAEYEMYRVYDRKSGWLDQRIRRVGHHGAPYGDAVCTVAAYTPFEDNRTAPAAPETVR